jgi:hypothetical protein
MTSPIPWSAEREYKLRRRLTLLWAGVWIGLVGGLLLLVSAGEFHMPTLNAWAGASWGAGFYLLIKLNEASNELGEEMRRLPGGQFFEGSGMLANKPRSTANLTKWCQVQVCPGQILRPGSGIPLRPMEPLEDYFRCGNCGKTHLVADMQWIPNYSEEDRVLYSENFIVRGTPGIDPNGGRFVILCPCGLGHYKLKA